MKPNLMTPDQLRQIEQGLERWRARHPDEASRRAAYRARILDLTLHSMALENEPVDRERLRRLLTQPSRKKRLGKSNP